VTCPSAASRHRGGLSHRPSLWCYPSTDASDSGRVLRTPSPSVRTPCTPCRTRIRFQVAGRATGELREPMHAPLGALASVDAVGYHWNAGPPISVESSHVFPLGPRPRLCSVRSTYATVLHAFWDGEVDRPFTITNNRNPIHPCGTCTTHRRLSRGGHRVIPSSLLSETRAWFAITTTVHDNQRPASHSKIRTLPHLSLPARGIVLHFARPTVARTLLSMHATTADLASLGR